MKTVHIITRLIVGGAQENTLHTCEDQADLFGDEVTLIFGPETGPEGSLHERARAGNYNVVVMDDLRRAVSPGADLAAYRRLQSLLRETAPDIVHTHSSKAGILGRAAAHRCDLPCVHTIHGSAFHYGQNPLLYRSYIRAEKWAAKRCDRIIGVCDTMCETYLEAGIAPREKFATVYSGFDVDPFLAPSRPRDEIRRSLGFDDSHVVVATVARLFDLKGHETLLDVAPRIAETPNVRFLWVGDGPLREAYERRIASMGLSDRFVLTGLVPPPDVPDLMHAADMICHPSQWEGLARVLPQGLIAGKPCISYDVGGAAEVVIDNETGFLFERNDSDSLADAILRLAVDAELRQRLGQNGRDQFTDLFRHETMTARLREEYATALAVHGSRRQRSKRLANA